MEKKKKKKGAGSWMWGGTTHKQKTNKKILDTFLTMSHNFKMWVFSTCQPVF